MADYYAYDNNLPCKNPNCKSHGRPHPNCQCYDAMGGNYAKGGEVQFCATGMPHQKGCEYFAEGGPIVPMQPAHPSVGLGHAAVTHGLIGLLNNVGRAKMSDPDAHHKTMDKVKEHLSTNDHEKAAGVMHGHPMGGGVGKENLRKVMERLGPAMMHNEFDPEALRSSAEYLNSSIKGHDTLKNHMGKTLGYEKMDIEPDEKARESLKNKLEEFQKDPAKMLEVGGKLGHYLPDHAAALGALTATANNHLNSLKPQSSQMGSLDEPTPPGAGATAVWNRHLDIANNPLMVLQHVKEGTLLPGDVHTLNTLYPGLGKSMQDKAGEALVDARTKEKEIPYKQKQALSLLVGEPLDSTMSPAAAQAIIQSAQPPMQPQSNKTNKQSKPTAAQLKQTDKVNSLYETPLEKNEMERDNK
jgi:hypothetical protein